MAEYLPISRLAIGDADSRRSPRHHGTRMIADLRRASRDADQRGSPRASRDADQRGSPRHHGTRIAADPRASRDADRRGSPQGITGRGSPRISTGITGRGSPRISTGITGRGSSRVSTASRDADRHGCPRHHGTRIVADLHGTRIVADLHGSRDADGCGSNDGSVRNFVCEVG